MLGFCTEGPSMRRLLATLVYFLGSQQEETVIYNCGSASWEETGCCQQPWPMDLLIFPVLETRHVFH